jgi:cytochrome c nitrite reductase small subunit
MRTATAGTARRWTAAAIVAGVLVALALGSGGYTFIYARGWSYLTDDPEACANCHVMGDHLAAWLKSSHRSVATCNECHTPHDPAGKYWTKADHGFWHSYRFTTGDFHEPIRMTAGSRAVVEGACRHCHADVTHDITAVAAAAGDDGISCIRCHAGVGHPR